ncbi:MAG TPA: hypothetical protein PLU75_05375 [Oscillospiraceae bacterium]|nr:hypothetical protein [Oscillospiraceae bacterium]HRW56847.1 hypothetical protein [Oscillospiraceae bacterium]
MDTTARFDMKSPPMRQKWYLQGLTWLISFPAVWSHKAEITKIHCEGLKPPFIFLGNHNAFFDFKVATAALFPWRANYVIAIDGFLKREALLRAVGGVCKRKFTSDVQLVRQIKKVLDNGDVMVIYPEARYSLCGTQAVLPDSLGKLCKLMRVPVVTFITHGHHIDSPFWNLRPRKVTHTEAVMKQLFTAEEAAAASAEVINDAIRKEFQYDDYKWQKQKGVLVDVPWRAEGLHKVLYQCPHCGEEYRMRSDKNELFCEACGKRYLMSELGELEAESGKTEFSHIPDWYEWERQNVRHEVETGVYSFSAPCHVDSLPNSAGYIRLGDGILKHDMNGFAVSGIGTNGDPFKMEKSVSSMYSCHIEYNYLGRFGDCIDLNTLIDTYYIYPHGEEFSVTKMALATEELYFHAQMQNSQDKNTV